jgi:hypothetical protein
MLMNHIQVAPAAGLKTTIDLMNLLEQKSVLNPVFVKFVNENFNSNCHGCIPGKIWQYMQKNFQYIPDDPFDEILTAPYILLQTKKGDCDDFSLFAKTCLDIIGGFQTNYLLLAKTYNQFSHIVVFCHRGKVGKFFRDPIILDGANQNFNLVSEQYKFFKII